MKYIELDQWPSVMQGKWDDVIDALAEGKMVELAATKQEIASLRGTLHYRKAGALQSRRTNAGYAVRLKAAK